MNKICTSIEESLKLIELGVDVNTADMYYPNRVGGHNYPLPIEYKMGLPLLSQEIPAWSLSALLEFINRNCYNISLNCSGAEWTVKFDDSETYHHITCDYSIDATFEMICWLKENKKI